MGTIVEFYTARQADDFPQPVGRGGPYVSTKPVYQLSHGKAVTGRPNRHESGSSRRGRVMQLSRFCGAGRPQRLKAQSVQWSLQSDEVLREIYEAVNEGINEAEWAKRGLLVVVR